MTLYLNEREIIPNIIILLCQENSAVKLFKLEPTSLTNWKNSISAKLLENAENNHDNIIRFDSHLDCENAQEETPPLNPCNPTLENYPIQQLKERFNQQHTPVPSLFTLLGVNISEYSIHTKPHPHAKVVVICQAPSHYKYSGGVFIKLTHLSGEEAQIMKYLQTLPPSTKRVCSSHIAKVYDFKEIFLKDDMDIFFACRELVKKQLGTKVCKNLDFDNIESNYSKAFFTFKTPIQISFLEMLQPLKIKNMLKQMNELRICTPNLKILILIRWIGQCLTILEQLHINLNILHCDVSFDNILTRKGIINDKVGQLILNHCPMAETLITDLVISDLNTAYELTQPQNNSIDEQRRTINPPDAMKFPYTWHTYEFYRWMQSDNYAMAIFIAKLVRRLLFEDFTDFLDCRNHDSSTFKNYGNCVITYFENKLNDVIDLVQETLLLGLIEFLNT